MRMVQVNLGGLLAWEFLLMHWVEVRRWQDYKNFGSVNEVRCVVLTLWGDAYMLSSVSSTPATTSDEGTSV